MSMNIRKANRDETCGKMKREVNAKCLVAVQNEGNQSVEYTSKNTCQRKALSSAFGSRPSCKVVEDGL